MSVRVKICGLQDEISVQAAIKAGADFIGFVYFTPSPRHIELEEAEKLVALLPNSVKSVMVLVNPDDDLLEKIDRKIKPDYFQLHGEESPERVQEIKQHFPNTGIIKAIAVRDADDIREAMNFTTADYILFDAKVAGSGTSFDWTLLRGNTPHKDWILSGGLNLYNIKDAIASTGVRLVDVSSGVESKRGIKDTWLITEFIKLAKS